MQTNENQPVFRASYSVLSLWKSGRYEDAVALYFKLETYSNAAMELGKAFHEEWQEETKKTGCLPAIFGGKPCTNPITEIKIVQHLEPWLDLVGVIDLLDSPTVHEYKSGVTSAAQYANSQQGGIYALLATLEGHLVDRLEYHRFNPYTKQADMAFRWVTDAMLEEAMEFVKTYAADMHAYLIENDLYAKLGQKKEGGVTA